MSRHLREDVRLMRQQDRRCALRHGGERLVEIVDPDPDMAVALGARKEGELVAQTREPEPAPVLFQADRLVVEDADARARQGLTGDGRAGATCLCRTILPPIVIAEDGEGAQRCPEAAEFGRPFGGLDGASDEVLPGDVVAEEHRQVAAERIGGLDDPGDAGSTHPRLAGMDVGQRHDAELQPGGPVALRRDGVARHRQAHGLDADAVGRRRTSCEGHAAEAGENRPARDPHRLCPRGQSLLADPIVNRVHAMGSEDRSTTTISGGTPKRTGSPLIPRPPETTRSVCSRTWP